MREGERKGGEGEHFQTRVWHGDFRLTTRNMGPMSHVPLCGSSLMYMGCSALAAREVYIATFSNTSSQVKIINLPGPRLLTDHDSIPDPETGHTASRRITNCQAGLAGYRTNSSRTESFSVRGSAYLSYHRKHMYVVLCIPVQDARRAKEPGISLPCLGPNSPMAGQSNWQVRIWAMSSPFPCGNPLASSTPRFACFLAVACTRRLADFDTVPFATSLLPICCALHRASTQQGLVLSSLKSDTEGVKSSQDIGTTLVPIMVKIPPARHTFLRVLPNHGPLFMVVEE